MNATKVYDYKKEAVRDKIVRAFKGSRGEATTADLVARTGLPLHQVATEVLAVSDEYGARLRVTESGEVLYSFPHGMSSRYRGFGPGLKRFLRALGKGAAAVGTFLFKIWIVVMLVGYFVLFLALALLALAASVAASASNKDDRRGSRDRGGLGGFYLVTRVFDLFVRIWFYSDFLKSPNDRLRQAERRRARKPLHHAVFSFVFGDPDPASGRDEAVRAAFASYVRSRKGIATVEELMALTGLPPEEAEETINRLAYELEGSPEVSQEGSIYYAFPALMRAAQAGAGPADPGPLPLKKFSANPAQANVWFSVFNGVNLAFGAYFLLSVLGNAPTGNAETGYTFFGFVALLAAQLGLDPAFALGVGLGVVPVAFGIFFWLVPALRLLRLKAENARRSRQNLRRRVMRAVLSAPDHVDALAIEPRAPEEAGKPEALVEELAAWSGADPEGQGVWRFGEIARRVRDLATVRAQVDESRYALGKGVFDTES